MSFWKSIFSGSSAAAARPGAATQAPRQYNIPENCLVYAIGDIHGRLDLLTRLMDRIHADRANRAPEAKAYIVFLGDYVDRGLQSREVLDYLNGLEDTDRLSHIFLAGNHEDLMLGFMEDPLENQLWLRVGGLQTLVSYGIPTPASPEVQAMVDVSDQLCKAVPEPHVAFLKSLKTWWRAGGYLFVHAGVRPGVPLEKQRRRDLLGIRQEFTESAVDFGFRVVHGHTGVPDVSVAPNQIAVDTGAFATGKLSAICLWRDSHDVLST